MRYCSDLAAARTGVIFLLNIQTVFVGFVFSICKEIHY